MRPHACRRRHIEGPYWLAKILGKAYQAEEDLIISGQHISKGYWLVEAQWYKLVASFVHTLVPLLQSRAFVTEATRLLRSTCRLLTTQVQTSQRAYVLENQEKIQLNVNAMVRLPEPIEFETVKPRKKPVVAAPVRACARLQGRPQAAPPPPPKPEREKPRLLGEPKHNEILVSLSDHRL